MRCREARRRGEGEREERRMEKETGRKTDRDQPMTCVMKRNCADSSLPSAVNPAVCVHVCVLIVWR